MTDTDQLAQLLATIQALPSAALDSHMTDEDYVAFVLEEMTREQEERWDHHLASCESCTQALDAFFLATAAWPSAVWAQQRWALTQQVRMRLQAVGCPIPVSVTLGERLPYRLSPRWEPRGAGVRMSATDTVTQEHVFPLPAGAGALRLTCRWRAVSRLQRATLFLAWKADSPHPGELWVRFTQRDTPDIVLDERRLGRVEAGEAGWSAEELGFDPSTTPWALTLLFMEPSA